MDTFFRFFYEFISIFFGGVKTIFNGFIRGVAEIFSYLNYKSVYMSYKDSFNNVEWIFVIIAVALLVIIILSIIVLLILGIRKVIVLSKNKFNKEDLVEEIGRLYEEVARLMKERDELMAMKVSQLGVNPESKDFDEESDEEIDTTNSRFPKLTMIDEKYKDYKVVRRSNNYNLQEILDNFLAYSASSLGLYYDADLLRAFIGGLAAGRIIILQGISGTGKTSLAYAWGKFVNNDSSIASVEPSWTDKTEFLGFFNEFTKKFNETDVLAALYEAGRTDDIHTIVLDEMNIARVEYYFAEFLSILEMPSKDEWIIEIVPSSWDTDPKHVNNGKIKLPGNTWYIGTINNDDSTFMVTDKVYDRAMPIDINNKVEPFESREQEAIDINASYLEELFAQAVIDHPVSKKNIDKVSKMDDYVIKHFRVAFGNRIMKQMHTFVPVWVATGGDEVSAIDYFIAKKIFRKFEQLNILFIKDEFDPFIRFLDKEFGKGKMKECISYIEYLKKMV